MQESITTNEDTTQHTTYSETDLDHSDADIKVKVLKQKLASRQKEAKRLRAQLDSSVDKDDISSGTFHVILLFANLILAKQDALKQQISRIDSIISEVKTQLSTASIDEETGLKPRIRSPSKDSSVSSNSRY